MNRVQSRSQQIRTLCECALMIALAVGLSYIVLIRMPFDGTVTAFSMLPICLISVRHGIKWGLGSAFCYSWFQILQGGVFGYGLTPGMLIASLFLDYILAFTVLGLAGLFRRKGIPGMVGGIVMVCVLRFLVHFLQAWCFGQTTSSLWPLAWSGSTVRCSTPSATTVRICCRRPF